MVPEDDLPMEDEIFGLDWNIIWNEVEDPFEGVEPSPVSVKARGFRSTETVAGILTSTEFHLMRLGARGTPVPVLVDEIREYNTFMKGFIALVLMKGGMLCGLTATPEEDFLSYLGGGSQCSYVPIGERPRGKRYKMTPPLSEHRLLDLLSIVFRGEGSVEDGVLHAFQPEFLAWAKESWRPGKSLLLFLPTIPKIEAVANRF